MHLSDTPPPPRAFGELERQRAQWFDELLEQSGFWDMTTLIDVFTGEVYFSREHYVVSATAIYEPRFREHLARAQAVNLTVKALMQTELNKITLVIKPAELDVSVKDNSLFAAHPD